MKAVDLHNCKAISKTVQHSLDGASSGSDDDVRPARTQEVAILALRVSPL